MTRPNLQSADAALANLRTEHALTIERVAELLGEPLAAVADWDAGRRFLPEDVEVKLARLAARLNFASLQRWKQRVTAARGEELLLGSDLSVLAVGTGVLTMPGATLPAKFYLGKHCNELFPSLDCNLILRHGAGLNDLREIGFFEGRVRCVRYAAELCYGDFARIGVFEYWPVETVDAGLVAHHICHVHADHKSTLRVPGVVVHWSEIVPAGGDCAPI